MPKPIICHIPVCPFSQRVEILLELKGLRDAVVFRVVDITKPRDPQILGLSRGTTALPIMDLGGGRVRKESLVILRYVEEAFPEPQIARADASERGVERLMIDRAGDCTMSGYLMVMKRDRATAAEKGETRLGHHAWLDDFLRHHNPDGTFLFDRFGLADLVCTPMFMRLRFLDYHEEFELPDDPAFGRVRRWRDAGLAQPEAQQVSYDEIVKLCHDHAVGLANGALAEGRSWSSFVFEPGWRDRPMPPRDKYDRIASDEEPGRFEPQST